MTLSTIYSPRRASFIAIIGLLGVFVVIVDYIAVTQVRDTLREHVVDKLRSDLQIVEHSLKEQLLKRHYLDTVSTLQNWMNDEPHIASIDVRAANGFVILQEQAYQAKHPKAFQVEVRHQNELLLTLSVIADLGGVTEKMEDIQWSIFTLSPIAALVLGTLLWLVVRRVAIVPMERAEALLRNQQADLKDQVDNRTRELASEVAERRKAELFAEEKAEFISLLLDALPAPVFVKNNKGVYVECNPAFETYLGRTRKEIINHTVYDLAPKKMADVYDNADREILSQNASQIYEASVLHSDGTEHVVEFHKAVYHNQDGTPAGIIGVILDITERKHLEEQMLQAKNAAENASKAKTEFLANMSHELRTPLNSIIGFSEMMEYEIKGPLPQDYHEYSGLIQRSGKLLLETIGSILDLAKIEAGEFELSKERVHMDEIVDEAIALMDIQAQAKGLEIINNTSDLLHLTVDHTRIKQVLLNVMGNAVKFTDHGHVTVNSFEDDHGLNITITDTGVGMTEEQVNIAFMPFRQVHGTSLARRYQGTGLGLSLSKQVMQLHGGDLWAKSTPGKGTTITLHFPHEAPTTH